MIHENPRVRSLLESDVRMIKKMLCAIIKGIKRNGDFGSIPWEDVEQLKEIAKIWERQGDTE